MGGTFWRSSMWYCGCSMAGPIRPSRSATAQASEICCAVHSDVPLAQQKRAVTRRHSMYTDQLSAILQQSALANRHRVQTLPALHNCYTV